eukprot:4358657-Amphidinium_carterae.1
MQNILVQSSALRSSSCSVDHLHTFQTSKAARDKLLAQVTTKGRVYESWISLKEQVFLKMMVAVVFGGAWNSRKTSVSRPARFGYLNTREHKLHPHPTSPPQRIGTTANVQD